MNKNKRQVQVAFMVVGGVATGLLAVLPGACGATIDAAPSEAGPIPVADAPSASPANSIPAPSIPFDDAARPPPPSNTHVVPLPDAGTLADAGALCTLTAVQTIATDLARVVLTDYRFEDVAYVAQGTVTVDAALLAQVGGLPQFEFSSTEPDDSQLPTVTNVQATATGFTFVATWSNGNVWCGRTMQAKVTLALDCSDPADASAAEDGGADADAAADVRTVIASTLLELCASDSPSGYDTWVSSGDECTMCRIIAEMAPSPVVSDNAGDDLPLGRVVQLRVVELARAGNQVLLFAENDAGQASTYAWSVSCGELQRLDDDLVLWTIPPDPDEVVFGQLGVWNEHGAAVENFLWAVAA